MRAYATFDEAPAADSVTPPSSEIGWLIGFVSSGASPVKGSALF